MGETPDLVAEFLGQWVKRICPEEQDFLTGHPKSSRECGGGVGKIDASQTVGMQLPEGKRAG